MVMTMPAGELRSAGRPAHVVLLDGFRAAWHAYLDRRARHVALQRVGHLGPRLMADMGLDSETIRAVTGGWDTLVLNGLLVPPSGRRR